MNESLKLRPEVEAFAQAMERKLRQNDHKGGWSEEAPEQFLRRVGDEWKELYEVVQTWRNARTTRAQTALAAEVLDEAADVANFALMVASTCGALKARKP